MPFTILLSVLCSLPSFQKLKERRLSVRRKLKRIGLLLLTVTFLGLFTTYGSVYAGEPEASQKEELGQVVGKNSVELIKSRDTKDFGVFQPIGSVGTGESYLYQASCGQTKATGVSKTIVNDNNTYDPEVTGRFKRNGTLQSNGGTGRKEGIYFVNFDVTWTSSSVCAAPSTWRTESDHTIWIVQLGVPSVSATGNTAVSGFY
jgi:hypothetical protein